MLLSDVIASVRALTNGWRNLPLRTDYIGRVSNRVDMRRELAMQSIRMSMLERGDVLRLVPVSMVLESIMRDKGGALSIRVQLVEIQSPCRGVYGYVLKERDHAYVVCDAGLNLCWQRFTIVKELMHLHSRTVGDGQEFRSGGDSAHRILSEAITSRDEHIWEDVELSNEASALAMALETLVPWCLRRQFDALVDQRADPYLIARTFMVPLNFIKIMLPPGYCDGAMGYGNLSNRLNARI